MNLCFLLKRLFMSFLKIFSIQEVQVTFLLLLLSGFSLLFLDDPLILFIHEHTYPYKALFRFMSFLIFPPLLLGISFLSLVLCRFVNSLKPFLSIFFAINLSQCLSVAVVRLFKVLIGRGRPDLLFKFQVKGFEGFSFDHHFHSFPSGHAMAIFALTSSISFFFPRHRTFFLFFAFFFSLSRLFLCDHYLSDLLGTAALGFILSWGVHLSVKRLVQLEPIYRK